MEDMGEGNEANVEEILCSGKWFGLSVCKSLSDLLEVKIAVYLDPVLMSLFRPNINHVDYNTSGFEERHWAKRTGTCSLYLFQRMFDPNRGNGGVFLNDRRRSKFAMLESLNFQDKTRKPAVNHSRLSEFKF